MQDVVKLPDVVQMDDPTCWQLRSAIAARVGRRQAMYSNLNKGTLNSVHAYLTGSFAVPKQVVNRPDAPDWQPRTVVLNAVVWVADLDPSGVNYQPYGKRRPNQLRKSGLKQLAHTMYAQDDSRDWL